MGVDDAGVMQHFLSKIKDEPKQSNIGASNARLTVQQDQPRSVLAYMDGKQSDAYNKSEGAKTPQHATFPGHDNHHFTSSESHPKPSPHVSGLKAPYNTPKNAPSSPRMMAMNTHNEEVGKALSEYVKNMDSRPLSESIWAPSSTHYKSSTLGGERSLKFLTPVKAVEPNPAINDTFDRMSFKAADLDQKPGENLIGDHLTRSLRSKASATVSQPSVLVEKVHGDKVDNFDQAKLDHMSCEDFKPATEAVQKAQKAQIKSDEVVKANSPYTIHSNIIGKENKAPPANKAGVPPHLRAVGSSNQQLIKTETPPTGPEVLDLVARSKVVDPGPVKDLPRTATNGVKIKITTGSTGMKPLAEPSSMKEDLEHKMVFNAWPKQEGRSKEGMFHLLLRFSCH